MIDPATHGIRKNCLKLTICALLSATAVTTTTLASAASTATFPVIVVFNQNATLPGQSTAALPGLPTGGLPVGGLPVGGLPVGGLPVGGLPVGGLPVGGLPVGGLPVGGLPVGDLPVGGLPVGGLPIGGLPVGGLPVGGLPIGGLPVGGLPVGGLPVGGLPIGGLPVGGLPVGGLPVGGLPVGGLPVGGLPIGGLPVGGLPVGGLPIGGLPVGGLPVGGLPVGGLPVGGLPVGGLPVGGLPVGGLPVGGLPVGGLPVGGLPVGGLPIGGLPVGGLPVGGLPVGGLPVGGLPVGGLPVGGLPVGGLPVGGLPVGGLPVGGLPIGGLPVGGLTTAGLPTMGIPAPGIPVADGVPALNVLSYLNPSVVNAVKALESVHGFRANHIYSSALRGFAARLTSGQIKALENNPSVAYVEADGVMKAIAQTVPYGIVRVNANLSSTLAGNGSGQVVNVNSYIIDTGIDRDHPDLNVVNHVNFITSSGGLLGGLLGGGGSNPNEDCNGHGTHVAGTANARDNTREVVGVAPGASLTGVKVLACNGSGSTSGVIQGIDWVTANAVKPAVANMSLGGGTSQALDDAVRRSANSGVLYVVAAGNEGGSACNSSPARAGAGTNNGIITVAATDSNDNEASFSNFGSCVDVWAPGVGVLSTRNGGGTLTLSGTSMSSPHVAGVGVLYLSTNIGATPATVESALKGTALSTGKVSKDGRAIRLVNARNY